MRRPLYHFDELPIAFDEVTELLADHLAAAPTEIAIPFGRFEISRQLEVGVGELHPDRMLHASIPITWHASEGARFFPTVEAELAVDALSFTPPLTQVSLLGSYEPPLGPVGALADALAGHRLAEAALRGYVDDLVERIRQAYAARHAVEARI